MMEITQFHESALLINFEQRMDREIAQRVHVLQTHVRQMPGVVSTIPAYCSLMVVLNLDHTTVQETIVRIKALGNIRETSSDATSHEVIIPVCYDPEFSPDMGEVISQTGQSAEAIIAMHTTTVFYAYLVGFIPGFAYLGDLPAPLHCKRRSKPRTHVPAGSVAIAGGQSAVYPFASPGGWQLIGRTPLSMFDPERDPPNRVQTGDIVHFRRIDQEAYIRLLAREKAEGSSPTAARDGHFRIL